MNITNLNSKWKNVLEFQNRKGYKSLRISSECKPDLFIATDTNGYRYLLLFLPYKIDVKIKKNGEEEAGTVLFKG